MEYIKEDDLNAIKAIIEEFEGETVLGKHMFKAIKAYFKQKERSAKVIYTPVVKTPKKSNSGLLHENRIEKIFEDADVALHKYWLKLSKKGKTNGTTKTKKKANS